ncbi:hypothetical protein Ciccas_011648 [Cichlidogyrus casuarinus]|uniref:Sema domain-containing protein n=1 Tax=Cichlidogyrus casuarinus TaxID=1844966 RepID=A0ABD2PQN0_9PLAT
MFCFISQGVCSFVYTLCTNDVGLVLNDPRGQQLSVLTTLFKARITCPILNNLAENIFYDEMLLSTRPDGSRSFYGLFRSYQSGIEPSSYALCLFNLEDVDNTFDSSDLVFTKQPHKPPKVDLPPGTLPLQRLLNQSIPSSQLQNSHLLSRFSLPGLAHITKVSVNMFALIENIP